jgi:hypothetical protein
VGEIVSVIEVDTSSEIDASAEVDVSLCVIVGVGVSVVVRAIIAWDVRATAVGMYSSGISVGSFVDGRRPEQLLNISSIREVMKIQKYRWRVTIFAIRILPGGIASKPERLCKQ